jgi:hypothetical protein
MSSNFDVSYQCVFGNQNSNATLVGNEFRCNLMKLSTNQLQLNISIVIVSNYKKNSLLLSTNDLPFYFMSILLFLTLDSLQLQSMIPHLTKYSIYKNLSSKIILSTNLGLLSNRNVYCRIFSDNGLKYSKIEYNSNNQQDLSCQISHDVISNGVEIIDVELWMNSSSNYTFTLSSNNQSHLYIPSNLSWNSKRIIDPNNLNIALNYNIPFRNFNYRLGMNIDVSNETGYTMNCVYENGRQPNCSFSFALLDNLKVVPLKLNFTFSVTHNYTKISQYVDVDYLVYYKTMNVEHLKPYVVSSPQTIYIESKFFSNIWNYQLNPYFSYFCNSNQFSY